MKIIVTESQYKRIISEQPESVMDRRLGIQDRNMKALGLNPSNPSDIKKYSEDVYGKSFTGHQVAAMLQIGTAFIPVVGPFISAGIGFLEAKSYWDEGDKNSAGITAALSTIPLIMEIPGVKQLTSKMISSIVTKIKNGGKGLTTEEQVILKSISDNKSKITSQLKSAGSKLNGVVNEVKSLKPNFIKKFGQEKYDNLLRDFISGKIDKETFIKNLNLTKIKPSFVEVTRGVKMTKEEFYQIEQIMSDIKAKKPLEIKFNYIKNGEPKEGKIIANYYKDTWKGVNNAGEIKINLNQVSDLSIDDIRQIIYHETTHAKDLSPIKFFKNKKGEIYVSGSGTHALEKRDYWLNKFKEIEKEAEQIKDRGESFSPEFKKKYNQAYDQYVKNHYAYKLSPKEIRANNQMVLNNLVKKTNEFIENKPGEEGIKRVNNMLSNFLDYLKGKGNLGEDASSIFGEKIGKTYFNDLYKADTQKYQEFVKKLTQQIQDIQQQIR